jgi:hypothetical protein
VTEASAAVSIDGNGSLRGVFFMGISEEKRASD